MEVVVASDEGGNPGAFLRSQPFSQGGVLQGEGLHGHGVQGEGMQGEGVRGEGEPVANREAAVPVPLHLVEGRMTVAFSLVLLDGEGGEVALTDGVQEVEVDLASGARAEAARVSVPPGDYEGFRATFTGVAAQVTAWPGGVTGPSLVVVDLSDGPLVVERGPSLTLGTDDRVRVVVDLRAGVWLVAADPSDGRVARGILQNAVRLQVETAG